MAEHLTIAKFKSLFASSVSTAKMSSEIAQLRGRSEPVRSLSLSEVAWLGERYGFLKRPQKPTAIAVFITKGGVLKTSLTLNLARVAALHNIRTCVVGLDMQGDITSALSAEPDEACDLNFTEALSSLDRIRGLSELMNGSASPASAAVAVNDLIQETDLPALQFIAETPELALLNQQIQLRNRREYWLKEFVVDPLKRNYDLILLDCSPNWNHLTTNALAACDALVSPLECKIHNFRNLKFFRSFMAEFQRDLDLQFRHVYVPTKFSATRRLSRDILTWYLSALPNCLDRPVRESLTGEEACALHRSMIEYAPRSLASHEMRQVLADIWKGSVGSTAAIELPAFEKMPASREPSPALSH